MRYKNLDLNLLVALDMLLAERNVSIAADRLCLSQSAMSGSLSRLREFFGDELLINTGRKMLLTPRAESLVFPVRNVLQQIKATITAPPEFIPAQSDREFSIIVSDYGLNVMMGGALSHIAAQAPNLTFDLNAIGDRPVQRLENREVDLFITVDTSVSPDHPFVPLFSEDFVVVAWTGNKLIGDDISQDLYYQLGHVSVQFGTARTPSFMEFFLSSLHNRRRLEVFAPSFTAAPFLVVGTQRIATVHRRLAEQAAMHLPLRIFQLPIETPRINIVAQWHASAREDKALMWVVEQIRTYAASGLHTPSGTAP